jgi:hypothetical protein
MSPGYPVIIHGTHERNVLFFTEGTSFVCGVFSCLWIVPRSILSRNIYKCLIQSGFSQALSTILCSMKGKSNIAVGGELACFVFGNGRFKISSQIFRKLLRCFRGFLQSLDEYSCCNFD